MRKHIGILGAMVHLACLASAGSGQGPGIYPGSINAGGNVPSAIPKGMQEYHFYGYTVWAINEKNARRKALKLKERVI